MLIQMLADEGFFPGIVELRTAGLLPAFRGKGGGSTLLKNLMQEADSEGKTVTIHVEMNNPALAWYQRLGFKEISTGGFHRLMEWTPDPAGQKA